MGTGEELSWPSASKDREDEDRCESVALILSGEGACVPGPEMSEQEQDVVRSQHWLVLWFVVQSKLIF